MKKVLRTLCKTGIAVGLVSSVGYSCIPSQWQRSKALRDIDRARAKWEAGETEVRKIYLTFDDGPDMRYTPILLDLLKEHRVPAAFFVISDFAAKAPELLTRMKKEGHTIGIHSQAHESLLIKRPKKSLEDLEASSNTLKAMGYETKYFRPPWGQLNIPTLKHIKEKGWELVLWDVMVGDWKKDLSTSELTHRIVSKTKTESIICLHDGRGALGAPGRTIAALKEAIPALKEKGFSFKSLSERE